MNKNINLIEILKDTPMGTKLYSPLFGEILLSSILNDKIICYIGDDVYFQGCKSRAAFNKYGQLLLSPANGNDPTIEVMLFPSESNRCWSTFNAPWEHKHFEPFQKILVNNDFGIWVADLYDHYNEELHTHCSIRWNGINDNEILPYDGNENKLGKQIK